MAPSSPPSSPFFSPHVSLLPYKVRSISFIDLNGSPGSHLLSAGAGDCAVRLWDVEAMRTEPTQTLGGHTGAVFGVQTCAGGNGIGGGQYMAITASSDQTVRVWDVRAPSCVRVMESFESPVHSVAVSPVSENTFVAGDSSGNVSVWDYASGQRLWQCPAHVGDVRSVQVRVYTLSLMFSIQCSNSHIRCSCKSSRRDLRPDIVTHTAATHTSPPLRSLCRYRRAGSGSSRHPLTAPCRSRRSTTGTGGSRRHGRSTATRSSACRGTPPSRCSSVRAPTTRCSAGPYLGCQTGTKKSTSEERCQ